MLSRGSTLRNRTLALVLFPGNVVAAIHCDLPICRRYGSLLHGPLTPVVCQELGNSLTDRIAYRSLFRFYAVHVYVLAIFTVPSCFRETETVCRTVRTLWHRFLWDTSASLHKNNVVWRALYRFPVKTNFPTMGLGLYKHVGPTWYKSIVLYSSVIEVFQFLSSEQEENVSLCSL